MEAPDLVELFGSLVAPLRDVSDNDLSAVPIPTADTHRIAKDANGFPCLLIRHSSHSGRSVPIRLENLLVSFDVPCTIVQRGRKPEQDTFTVVRCTASNTTLFRHFLRIVSPMIAGLGQTPTHAAVRRAISGLVELFQALTAPAKKTIQGVWAELLMIQLAGDPHTMAAAWHRNPLEHFDFAAGVQRIEVKSTGVRRRAHHFSLAQLAPVEGTRVLVASVFVERSGGGTSLQRLFENVRERLTSSVELTARLDATFYGSLGSGWEEAMNEAFDWELARQSLAFFSADDIPRPGGPIPATVSDINFCSDLSSANPVDLNRLLLDGGIFAAVVSV